MTDREIMQQALEALEIECKGYNDKVVRNRGIIAALRERLAQPQRTHWEGCEEVHPECRKPEQDGRCQRCGGAGCSACDARHLRREWVGLTEEEVDDIYDAAAEQEPYAMVVTRRNIARAIEAKLKEKNA